MPAPPRLAWIEPGLPLPDPQQALDEPNGLLAAGRDLGADRLLEAYQKGIFPWYTEGQPVLWWSPDPRMVLQPGRFKASRSLTKTVRALTRTGRWTLRLNSDFEAVIRACAAPRRQGPGTWISEDIVRAYGALHRRGHAHSVEVWSDCGTLIGGLYGVSIGRMFYGESMFARVTDASKLALFALARLLQRLDFPMIDCQQSTRHLASLGAQEVSREEFLRAIADLVVQTAPDWSTLSIEIPQA
jgi:leucyl/phenylalanyl-tRNA--protein transferase